MKHGTLILLITLLILAIFALLGGCAPGKEAIRSDTPPSVEVRVPLVEPPAVSLRAEEPAITRSEPFSVGDEYRDRWLRLIEIDITRPQYIEPAAPAESPE